MSTSFLWFFRSGLLWFFERGCGSCFEVILRYTQHLPAFQVLPAAECFLCLGCSSLSLPMTHNCC